jgi:hypothetical protein
LRALLLVAGLLAAGCSTYPLGSPGPGDLEGAPRPTLPLPASVAARYTPAHPGFALQIERLDAGGNAERYRFRFQTFSEVYLDFRTVEGTWYRTLKRQPGAAAPLVQVSPILGGAKDDYLACRVFGRWAAAEGMSSFYLHQDADILTGDRDAIELDRLLRENILANRKTLDLFLALPGEVDPRRLGSLGISLGAVKNVLLAAVEPRFSANVLCLAGGDIPRILLESRERMVVRYLNRRRERDGLSGDEVAEEFRRHLSAEPLYFAQFLPPEKALMFLGCFDDRVPYGTGLQLHRALGRPMLHVFPVGHYTSILMALRVARQGFGWMKERFQSASGVAVPGTEPSASPVRASKS